MKSLKPLLPLIIATVLLVGGLYWASAQTAAPTERDPRLDKIIEQNELIIKNQEAIQKTLEELKRDMLQLRRRTS